MSHEYPEDDRLAAHRANLIASGVVRMTVDEVLAGNTQAGVPRPSFLKDHNDDGTVESVGGRGPSMTVNEVRALEGLPPVGEGTRDGTD